MAVDLRTVPVNTPLNPIILSEIVYKCAHKRKDIGHFLGIEPYKMEINEEERDVNNRFMNTITQWSNKDNGTGPAEQPRTAQRLYDAITDAGFPDVAEAFKAQVVTLLSSSDSRALLDISSTPDLRDVDDLVVTAVASNWQSVALRLGVQVHVIEFVSTQYPNDCKRACRNMLDRWLRGERNTGEEERTWSTLLIALSRAGFADPVRSLQREHFTKVTSVLIGSSQRSDQAAGTTQTGSQAGAQGPSGGAAQTESQPGAQGTVAFALITANATEQKVVRHFFKLGDAGQVWKEAVDCNYTTDFYLKKEQMKVDYHGTHSSPANGYEFEIFTVSKEKDKVIGIHVKCLQQASFTKGGSQRTTTALLQFAKEQNWQLELIFSVGCCGLSADDTSEEKVRKMMGRVLLSNVYKSYLDRGKVEDTGLKFHSQFYEGAREWVSHLEDHSITQPGQHADDDERFRVIPVAEVPQYATGPLVIKVAQFGNEVRGEAYQVGLEMEASGIASALEGWAVTGHHVPKFLLLKGVSDFGSNKGEKVKASFFGKPTAEEVLDDNRQEIATFHCVALVTRGVARKFLCSKKFLPGTI